MERHKDVHFSKTLLESTVNDRIFSIFSLQPGVPVHQGKSELLVWSIVLKCVRTLDCRLVMREHWHVARGIDYICWDRAENGTIRVKKDSECEQGELIK